MGFISNQSETCGAATDSRRIYEVHRVMLSSALI
jgi:hypothetical protein